LWELSGLIIAPSGVFNVKLNSFPSYHNNTKYALNTEESIITVSLILGHGSEKVLHVPKRKIEDILHINKY